MALTVSELRSVFTADTRDFERGAQSVQRSMKQTGSDISRTMRKAGDDAGQGLEKGVTQGARGAGDKAGREIDQGVRSQVKETGKLAGEGISKGLEAAGFLGIGATAGLALTTGVGGAITRADVKGKLQAQLGSSGADAGRYGKAAGDLWKGAWGDSLADTGDAVKAVVQNIGGMRQASTKELTAVTGSVLALNSAFDESPDAISRAADQMVRTGLAKNAKDALDIITVGFQKGANEADDLLDTFDEYGTQLRKLGLDGREATGLLQQGLKGGARDADTVADALKEFSIRAIDGSKSTAAGFKLLGLDGQAMGERIAKGGDSAQSGLQVVLDRLRGIQDPVKRNAAAVDLFGTKAEDLGGALNALDPSKAASGLGKVGGAAKRAGDALNTPTARVEAFKRSLQSDLIDFVDQKVIPTGKKLGQIKHWFDGLPDGAQKTAKLGGGLALGLAAALVTAKKLRDIYGTLKEGASVISGGAKALGGSKAKTALPGLGGSAAEMTVKAAVVNVYGSGGKGAPGVGGGAGTAGGAGAGAAGGGALSGLASLLGGFAITAAAPLALSQYGLHQSSKLPKEKANGGAYVGSGFGGVGGYNDAIPNAKDLKSSTAEALKMLDAQKKAVAGIPKEVATKITAPGAKLTVQDVEALAKQYHLTPAQVKTLMGVTGVDETKAKVTDYLGKLHLTPDQIKTAMAMDTTEGTGKLTAYLRRLGLTPHQVKTVVSALTSGAQGDISSVLRRLGIVDRTTATPTVKVKADLTGFYATQRALNQLHDRTVHVATIKSAAVRQATGGWVSGPGGPREDKVPAWLSNGEYVVNAAASARHGRLLEHINSNKYADGGRVGGSLGYAAGGPVAGGTTLPGLGSLDFTRLTDAWLKAAQASMTAATAAKATASSRLDDLNAQKQIRDLQSQLGARTNNTAQIRELTKALTARDKKGRLEVTGTARVQKTNQLRQARAGNGAYEVKGLDRSVMSAELTKAREDLATLRAQAAAAALSDKGTSVRDKALERSGVFGTSAVTASQLLKNLQTDAITNQTFAGIVAQLSKAGLSKDLLDQFTANGPSSQSLALGRSILATGNIAQLNAAQSTIGTQATQAGYQADGVKAPGAGSALVNIEAYYENGKSTNQIAEELYFKSQMRTG